MSKVFLYRTKEADDRDCCAYIDIADLEKCVSVVTENSISMVLAIQ